MPAIPQAGIQLRPYKSCCMAQRGPAVSPDNLRIFRVHGDFGAVADLIEFAGPELTECFERKADLNVF